MAVNPQPRVRFSEQDARAFSDVAQRGSLLLEAEHFQNDVYLDEVIRKPWGHEYRIYCDNLYDIWKLSLREGEATSMHCHPRKETALLCLKGTARVSFLGGTTHIVRAMNAVHISKGVWHGTTNVGSDELDLIEVELPRNKFDLLRLTDRYGRARVPYEHTSESADCPIHPRDAQRGSKLRLHCVRHHYRFQLLTGRALAERSSPPFLFLVSLGLRDAIEHQIRVYSASHPRDGLDPDTSYLLITKEALV